MRGYSSVGRASHLQCEGQRFESAYLHQTKSWRAGNVEATGSNPVRSTIRLVFANAQTRSWSPTTQTPKPDIFTNESNALSEAPRSGAKSKGSYTFFIFLNVGITLCTAVRQATYPRDCKLTKRAKPLTKWTKIRRPVQLIYFETYDSLLAATRRELQVKGWVRSKKDTLIRGKWKKQFAKK